MMKRYRRRLAWFCICSMLFGTVAAPVFAYHIPIKGYPNLEVNGNNTLSLNLRSVSGSQATYRDDNYGRDRAFTHSSNLYLTGEIAKDLHLNATFMADPNVPNNTRWNLRYDGNDAKVMLGEFTANLPGNEFVQLNRSLKGVQVDSNLPKGGVSIVTSQLSAQVHTDTIYGQNTSGPYYLSNNAIVEGSEVVSINGQRKERQRDYNFDYISGILNFVPGIIVSPGDRITVSYETAENGMGGGQLYAVRGYYPIGKGLTVGVNHLALNGRSRAATTEKRTDQFIGNGVERSFVLTTSAIETSTVIVKLNNIIQTPGEHYTLEMVPRPTVKFKNSPSIDSRVLVEYQYTIPGDSGQDRAITGLDIDWQNGNGLGLNLQAAKSDKRTPQVVTSQKIDVPQDQFINATEFQLPAFPIEPGTLVVEVRSTTGVLRKLQSGEFVLNSATGKLRITTSENINLAAREFYVSYKTSVPEGDTAMALTGTYNKGKLAATARYRQSDPGFSPMEAVGYRNTENELSWSTSYTPNPSLIFSTTGSNSRLPYDPYNTSGAQQAMMEEKNRTYSVEYHAPNKPVIALSRATRDAKQTDGNQLGDSSIADTLAINWIRDALTASLNLNRTSSDSRNLGFDYATGVQDPNKVVAFKGITNNAWLNVNYQPSERLNVGVSMAANKITSQNEQGKSRSGGNNVGANATYRLTQSLTLNASHQANKTDAVQNDYGLDVPAYRTRNSTVGLDWRASDKLTMGVNLTTDKSKGSDTSNSSSKSMSANVWYKPGEKVSLNGYYLRQNQQYLDQSGNSKNNMVGVSAEVGPIGKARVNLDAQHLWGENSFGVEQLYQTEGQAKRSVQMAATDVGVPMQVATGNKLTTLAGKITYPISQNQDLFVSGEVLNSKGFPSESKRRSYGLGWNYHINENLTFTLNGQRVKYSDKAYSDNNYGANQLNAQLSWNF